MNRYSILQDKKQCYVCGTIYNLHTHEVYFGRNRQKSIEDGCCIYLCGMHHNLSKHGIHFDSKLDKEVKQKMQLKWQEKYCRSEEDFIERYGRNYI